ncbi:class I SAM-dependent methyltransferase [Bacillus fonticola]|uniref:class I SAM-dependent methyltransferase n=1 Tax=Bacillus fonticola TaxID=2728853 RepID=UPI0014743997|nr:class I SAM-dependent methyltransferase [Bacillus fonticola]
MGREFLSIFEDWADRYDSSTDGKDPQYAAVFLKYEEILQAVADAVDGNVVEFGAGTGNLTTKLLQNGCSVIAIEPSEPMRAQAQEKLGNHVTLLDGDFLHFEVEGPVDHIVSSYAFHHLTDEEKGRAIRQYASLLSPGGKVVFADTMFPTNTDFEHTISKAKEDGFFQLAEDLEREYYTTHTVLRELFESAGFVVTFKQYNEFVWLLEAKKWTVS